MIKTFPFRLDIEKEYNNRMYSVNSNDLKTVKFTFVVTDNGIPLDLTGLTVRIAIRKPDKKAVWQDCTVTNAQKGEVEVILESQAYIKKGEHEAELMLYKGTDTVAITQKFHYRAAEGIMSDKSLKSETVLGPIDQKLAEVEETLNDIRKNGTGIDPQARQGVEEVTAQLAEKVTKADLDRLGSGSPKGVFETLSDLETTFPNGDNGIYIVKENGNWYFWSNSVWTLGGTYLGQPDGRIQFIENELNLRYNKYTIKNGIPNPDFNNDVPSNFGSGGLLEIVNGKLRVTKPNDNPIVNLGIETDLPYRAGKYFFTMKVTPLTPGVISLHLFPSPSFGSDDILYEIQNPIVGQEYTISAYETLGDIAQKQSVFFHLRGQYEEETSPGSFEIRQPMGFDLTQIYGQGNEPTKEEFINKLNNNFDGFISTLVDDYKKIEDSKIDTVKKPLSAKLIVNFGDSIFGSYEEPNNISNAIAEKTGATVINVGFGGCRMGAHYGHWDAFSMYRLSEAISTGDFSRQDQAVIDGTNADPADRIPTYFTKHIELLKSIDWKKVDAITIGYGTNDFYNDDIGLDSSTNPYEVWTYKGAMRYSIEKILTKFPSLKMMFLTPIYRTFTELGNEHNSDNYIRRGLKLTDFVQATKDICDEYHIRYFDGYYKLGFNTLNRYHYFPEDDGAHPNPLGRARYGEEVGSDLISWL